jgi:hypothetical protein
VAELTVLFSQFIEAFFRFRPFGGGPSKSGSTPESSNFARASSTFARNSSGVRPAIVCSCSTLKCAGMSCAATWMKRAGELRAALRKAAMRVDGARTMMLVYNLPATDAIYQRFAGIEGSAYLVGGLGMTALTMNNIVVVPIRTGVGIRLGANVGYLKFTPTPTWNPF